MILAQYILPSNPNVLKMIQNLQGTHDHHLVHNFRKSFYEYSSDNM